MESASSRLCVCVCVWEVCLGMCSVKLDKAASKAPLSKVLQKMHSSRDFF